jgi:hypothetical protein
MGGIRTPSSASSAAALLAAERRRTMVPMLIALDLKDDEAMDIAELVGLVGIGDKGEYEWMTQGIADVLLVVLF